MRSINKNDSLQIKGVVRLTAQHKITGEQIIMENRNVVCTVGKYQVLDMLIDVTGYDTGITYQAIGTDNTTPAAGDTTLGSEQERKVFTDKSRSGLTITFSTFFTAAESTYDIQEVGIFGHSTATASADSGILFAHALLDFDNSGGNYDLTIEWSISIT